MLISSNLIHLLDCLKLFLIKSFIYSSSSLQALPSLSKEIIEVLDILLRWFVLQLCKSNTTCLLKVICNCFFCYYSSHLTLF